jgi:hypothetical protein
MPRRTHDLKFVFDSCVALSCPWLDPELTRVAPPWKALQLWEMNWDLGVSTINFKRTDGGEAGCNGSVLLNLRLSFTYIFLILGPCIIKLLIKKNSTNGRFCGLQFFEALIPEQSQKATRKIHCLFELLAFHREATRKLN